MTYFFITIAFALCALTVLLLALRKGRPVALRDWRELPNHTVPVDTVAFQRLLDEADSEFVRRSLTPAKFRTAQRLRVRAAFSYLARVRQNAAVLLGVGEEARRATEPAEAQAGERLVQAAIAVRINSTMLMLRLAMVYLFPTVVGMKAPTVTLYENLRWNVQRLTNLRDPHLTSRISAAV
jgi:hypothetical protein